MTEMLHLIALDRTNAPYKEATVSTYQRKRHNGVTIYGHQNHTTSRFYLA